MSKLVEELHGKRVLIGSSSMAGAVEMVVAKLLDSDDKFAKVETEPPKIDKYDITPGIRSLVPIDTINTIIDISDTKSYELVMKQMAMAQQRAQRQRQPPPTEPPYEESTPVEPSSPPDGDE